MFTTGRSWRLFTAFGVPIRLEPSILIMAVILFAFQGTVSVAALLSTTALVLVLVFSVLAHELGHAIAIRRLGYGGSTIVIGGFGGYTQWGRTPTRADRIRISLAGPAVSLALGVIGLIVLQLSPAAGTLAAVILYPLAWVNLFWGIFNLLPVHPMDGGHVVRAWLGMRMPVHRALLTSLRISFVVGGLALVGSLVMGETFIAILLAFLLFQNWQEWQQAHSR